MRKTAKKGFTIVELVIVIAVVAVLAAVLIPTFVGLVSKANNSADVQMVTNINKYLAAMENTDGKNTTMAEAMKDVADAGYNAGALSNANNKILWNEKTDRFLAVSEKGKTIASADDEAYNIHDTSNAYWIVSTTVSETYATYLTGKAELPETITLGLDLTEYTGTANVKFSGADGVVLNGTFQKLEISGTGKPTVHGYVVTLSGNIQGENVQFHQTKEAVGAQVAAVGGTVEYGVHVFAEKTVDAVCTIEGCTQNYHDHAVTADTDNSVDASCVSIGVTISKCTCGYTEVKVLPALGHTWGEVEAGKAPTCDTSGYSAKKECSVCGIKGGNEYLASLGHTWGDDGKCTVCGKDKSEVVQEISQSMIDVENATSFVNESGSGYFKLTENITIDATKFQKLFTKVNDDYMIPAGIGEDGKWYSASIRVGFVDYIEWDLNGKKLTIVGDDFLDSGHDIGVLGTLKITNGTLVLNDDINNFAFLEIAGASADIEGLTVHTYGTFMRTTDKNQSVSINDSTLTVYKDQYSGEYEITEYKKIWYSTFNGSGPWPDGFVAGGDSLGNVEIKNEGMPESISGESD